MNKLNHIALIMDGNGRWAEERSRPRIHGHIRGTKVAKEIIQYASKSNLKYLTLYAFSTENWLRPKEEVSFLMSLLERYLKKEADNLVKLNIQFETIGDLTNVPTAVVQQIRTTKEKTKNCTGLKVIFALGYGSRHEIQKAIQNIACDVEAGKISSNQIDESMVRDYLMTRDIPDPDLIIRTSGEKRISNFLLWQSAYSELYFTEKLWPDFKETDFDQAISSFQTRNRRFGTVNSLKKDSQVDIRPNSEKLNETESHI